MDKDSKVILLPESQIPFKILKLPTPTDLNTTKSYLLQETTLYELNIIDGSTDENIPKLKSGAAVKSFIFEPGYVLQSPNVIISNKFNFTYLLIALVKSQRKKFDDKFISLDDFKDILNIDWIYEIPEQMITAALEIICETVNQNGEEFYKFSIDKCLEWVHGKILRLKEFIIENNTSILQRIKTELSPNMEEIPSDKLHELTLVYALDYITSSYCSVRPELVAKFDYKLDEVSSYLKKLKEMETNIDVMEANLVSLKTSNKAQKDKKKVTVAAKKVVKRGAIDSFFKKATK
ncbi:hypothetical protein Cantr_02594 [Candida viswanathii]|uniref:Ribonuclease H2 subunit B n=1 Tax=Candida viswanathii TaxID=5486 RepID=A0A367YN50_9ASCO|nr:hypothetical protein Cantr_02594 [Candida viswanathii]